jgi:hypothetical protein
MMGVRTELDNSVAGVVKDYTGTGVRLVETPNTTTMEFKLARVEKYLKRQTDLQNLSKISVTQQIAKSEELPNE